MATGSSFTTIGYNFKIAGPTVSKIVSKVSDAIWKCLQPIFMKEMTTELWLENELYFRQKCNFPNCVGAVDGKHVYIKSPPNSGSDYFNYKKSFSLVLLAVVDARYKFIAIDVGSKGRFSDAGIFSNSAFGKKLKDNLLFLPESKSLEEGGMEMPYIFVGDEAFPLLPNLMRPYPQSQLNNQKRIYNYRLSRARRVVEQAFGILAARWRVFHTAFGCNIDTVDKVIKAACVLHNYLSEDNEIQTENSMNSVLRPLRRGGNSPSITAYQIREEFSNYFNGSGSVPWQNTSAHINEN